MDVSLLLAPAAGGLSSLLELVQASLRIYSETGGKAADAGEVEAGL